MLKINKLHIVYVILYAIPHTLLHFGIIYIINNVLVGNEAFLKTYMGFVFISFIVYAYLLNVIFQKKLNQYTFKILYDSEKKLFKQLLNAPIKALDKFGSERFYTVMTDLRAFSGLPYVIKETVCSLMLLILGLGYMFTISVVSASIVFSLIVIMTGVYFFIINLMSSQMNKLREYDETYHEYIKDLVDGFKEFKLSLVRRTNVVSKYLNPNRDKSEQLDYKLNYVFLSLSMISEYGLHFVIAVILFILPAFDLISQNEMLIYVIILLFITGPINNLINLQQTYTRFLVAINRVKQFLEDFKAVESKEEKEEQIDKSFELLQMENITFRHKSENGEFVLGPIDFQLRKGEIVFISGGNGSGKSTFINLLSGLYTPENGAIRLNDKVLNSTKDGLHGLIAAIYTDNHLFSNNYEDFPLKGNTRFSELIQLMRLEKIIGTDHEYFTRKNLSKGQSKRLALIFSLLEDKPILILDEWAAEQDPEFRKYFYRELLPQFRAMGKTVLAVTHDDTYFDAADRMIKFEYGRIVN
ncbi:MAG: cyclic peptide export ABC transporter [Cytophagales bacterium]|nr:cyclic peptide export ABC transporter [Cytophagales bacterium]